MSTDSNIALVAGMYEAAKRGDVDGFVAGLAPDVVVIEPDFLPYGGRYHGIDGFLALFGGLTNVFHVPGLRVEWVIADGDKVLGSLHMPLADQASTYEAIEQSTIRDGKVVEMQIFVHNLGALQPR